MNVRLIFIYLRVHNATWWGNENEPGHFCGELKLFAWTFLEVIIIGPVYISGLFKLKEIIRPGNNGGSWAATAQ